MLESFGRFWPGALTQRVELFHALRSRRINGPLYELHRSKRDYRYCSNNDNKPANLVMVPPPISVGTPVSAMLKLFPGRRPTTALHGSGQEDSVSVDDTADIPPAGWKAFSHPQLAQPWGDQPSPLRILLLELNAPVRFPSPRGTTACCAVISQKSVLHKPCISPPHHSSSGRICTNEARHYCWGRIMSINQTPCLAGLDAPIWGLGLLHSSFCFTAPKFRTCIGLRVFCWQPGTARIIIRGKP